MCKMQAVNAHPPITIGPSSNVIATSANPFLLPVQSSTPFSSAADHNKTSVVQCISSTKIDGPKGTKRKKKVGNKGVTKKLFSSPKGKPILISIFKSL